MRAQVVFALLLLLSGLAFAAADEAEEAHGEAADEHGEEHHGMEMGEGLQLVAIASLGSLILLAVLYFLLSRR